MALKPLNFILDVRHGLCDLLADAVLNDAELEQLRSETNDSVNVERLVNYFEEMSQEQKQKFLVCLDKSGQSHVTRFITNNGQRPTDDAESDDWPLYVSSEWSDFNRKRSRLIELIDSRNGLVDDMFQEEIINFRQYDSINGEGEHSKRNSKLMEILQRLSLRNYKLFTGCLERTKQRHVMLEAEPGSDLTPLTEKEVSVLRANYTYLLENVESGELLNRLFSTQSLTRRQIDYITSTSETAERNKRLIDIIRRGNQLTFKNFVQGLSCTGQEHLVRLLETGGVTAQIVAHVNGAEDVDKIEEQIVERFKELLTTKSHEDRRRVLNNILEHVDIIEAKTVNSIKLYFLCRSMSGLQALQDCYASGELKHKVAHIFNVLLLGEDAVGVERIVWEISDYNFCATTLLQLAIESKRSELIHLIDLHHGLLSTLQKAGILSEEQVYRITQKGLETDQVGQLFDEVFQMSYDDQKFFVSALKDTGQPHVVDRIMNDEDAEVDASSDVAPWQISKTRTTGLMPLLPILYSEEWENFDRNWCNLIDSIDCGCGLLDELLQRGCINEEHLKDIISTPIPSLQNSKLLQFFRRSSVGNIPILLECLESTKQHYVRSLFTLKTDYTQKPINEMQRIALRTNFLALMNLIDVIDDVTDAGSSLLNEMLNEDCITRKQMDFVMRAETRSEANRRLLKIVEYGSEIDFGKFAKCLSETERLEAYFVITGGGVCICFVADVAQKGDLYVTTARLESDAKASNILASGTMEVSDRNNIELVAIRKPIHDSQLKFVVRCLTPECLHRLHLLHVVGVLQLIIRKALISILLTYFTDIPRIDWNISEYLLSAHFLYKSLALLCHAEIYRLASEEPASDLRTLEVFFSKPLPEIIRSILKIAYGLLFQLLRPKTSQAELYSIVSLMSVCRTWRDEIANWKSANHVKRRFKTYCQPYRPTARKVKEIELGEGCFYGIAQLKGSIYVLGYSVADSSAILHAYAATAPYNRKDIIRMSRSSLGAGTDLIACSGTGQLYVAGYLESCIWQINVDDENRAKKFITLSKVPWTMSFANERFLITFHGGNLLQTYNNGGELIRHTVLPENIYACHAKELFDGTVVVCHVAKPSSGQETPGHNGISQFAVSLDGSVLEVLRIFISGVIHSTPFYLDVDRDGNILLADRSKFNVVLLKPTDSDYSVDRLILCNTELQPKRMSFDEDSRLLCISFYGVNSMRIYSV